MKHPILIFVVSIFCVFAQAQKQFHVTTDGSAQGDGTTNHPWDLQTALSQKPSVINGGDTIWLHEGIYNGRYLSTIKSDKENEYITVMPYKNARVTLNGNVNSDLTAVLNVKGKQVIFRDFEITWLGDFSRDEKDPNLRKCAGIYHTAGEDCRFYNLDIHDNPGLGIGSWKSTGGTIIENCRIYYNGFVAKDGKGRGEGIYVQNKSDKTRIIQNNIIFANYYKGIEVWSAGRDADFEYVKNITLKNNVIFNSGVPSGHSYDNVIVATDDRNGTNIAKNINVIDNVFYHNTDYLNNKVSGDAPSLTIGYVDNTPVEDIVISNNIILGRNNPLRLLHIKSMTMTDNNIYGGYVFLNANEMQYTKNWKVNSNTYFTKKASAYRVNQDKNYGLKEWQTTFKLDKNSQWKHIKEFDLPNVLSVSKQVQKPNTYTAVLFNKEGKDVSVDLSNYAIKTGETYKIVDVENPEVVIAKGRVTSDKMITVPMTTVAYKMPLHNSNAKKTPTNFGVFLIEFKD